MLSLSRSWTALRRAARGSFVPMAPAVLLAVSFCAALAVSSNEAHAMKIQQVKSPGGISAWLVEEHGVPLLALRFAFDGGNAQDPPGKEGVANFISAMLDEGAGELRSQQYQERMEELALRMSYEDSRDAMYGSF
jgi:zinc protease